MIASISGEIQIIGDEFLVINIGGVGIRVLVPGTVLEKHHQPGRAITLNTHLYLRENDLALYGFLDREELELFQQLLTVSGIGPRLALAILSTLSPEVLTAAVAREEPEIFQRVPGIGKKTSQRILFHLKDKLDLDRISAGLTMPTDVDADVISALTSLGYSIVEAQAAVQKIPRESSPELDERIRLALKNLAI
ncbi:MAG: Holliday junction branch migration protein RuvA [Anaerolineales bacterium]|nr:Holliday junction branch migration protein RuvA [Anaerolineales bacterium]